MHRAILCTLVLGLTASATQLPLFFEPNQGQAPAGIQFLSRGNGVTSFLSAGEARLTVGDAVIRMELAGASPSSGEATHRLPGLSSYFMGRDAGQWHTRVPQFDRVRFRSVYPGVDLVYYGHDGELEYDFVLAPGAQPSAIRLAYKDLKQAKLDSQGDLILTTTSGEIRQKRPVAYQEIDGQRVAVTASYRLRRGNQVEFALGHYDSMRPLVIDPVIQYSSYFGGTATSYLYDMKSDSSGNVYLVVGSTTSTTGGVTASAPWITTIYKFSPSQNTILYSATYPSTPSALALDSNGSVLFAGQTQTNNLPMVNAYQSVNHMPLGYPTWTNDPHATTSSTGFVAKLSADGQSLIYSTYLGGSTADYVGPIAVDSAGNAYVTGNSESKDFPMLNAYQSALKGNMIPTTVFAKFSPSGNLLFSTFFGGSIASGASGIVVDHADYPILVGMARDSDFPVKNAYNSVFNGTESAFVAKFTPDGQPVFSTFYGGDYTLGAKVAVDSQNRIYFTGTPGRTIPIVNALQPQRPGDGASYIAELSADGSQLLYSTYFGGGYADYISSILIDGNYNLYVAGQTYSANFPTRNSLITYKSKSLYAGSPQAGSYGFVTKIGADGQSLYYSTLLGGYTGGDGVSAIAPGPSGSVYLAGGTGSTDLPMQNAYQSTSAAANGTYSIFLMQLADGANDTLTTYAQPGQGVSLSASPEHVLFNTSSSSTTPLTQVITLSATGGTPTFTATATSNNAFTANFLSVSPTSGTAPGQITVTANPTGLSAGTYIGSVTVTPSAGTAVTIPVVMMVSPGVVALNASPSTLAFTASANGAAPAQTFSITSSSSDATFWLMPNSTGNWLSATANSSTTPGTATVNVNTSGLSAGTYSGWVTVLTPGGQGTTVNVTLTITGTASSTTSSAAVIQSVSPSTLSPDGQNHVVTVTGSGFTSGTTANIVFLGFEFPSTATPVTFVNNSTLQVTVRGLFLFQTGSVGLRLTTPGRAESSPFSIAIQ